jgi:regulator of sigma E protease
MEQLSQPAQPYEFRSKPAWQRLLIMIGGVSVNMILAYIIYIGVLWSFGDKYLPTDNLKFGVICNKQAQQIGFRDCDKIVSVANKHIENFDEIASQLVLDNAPSIQVKRGDKVLDVALPSDFVQDYIKNKSRIFEPAYPFVVEDLPSKSNAKAAGIKVGDQVIGINDSTFKYYAQYPPFFEVHKNQEVKLKVLRGKDTLSLNVLVNKNGKIGVVVKGLDNYLTLKTLNYSFWQAIPAGITKGQSQIGSYFKQLKLIFSPETKAYESLGGFIAIAKQFAPVWDWYSFWMMTALLSIMLGVINIFPIPALDGGHVMFLLFEIITRRKPGLKFMEYAQIGGLIILLCLVLFANGNDIVNLFKK